MQSPVIILAISLSVISITNCGQWNFLGLVVRRDDDCYYLDDDDESGLKRELFVDRYCSGYLHR